MELKFESCVVKLLYLLVLILFEIQFISSFNHSMSSFIHLNYHALQICTGKVRGLIKSLAVSVQSSSASSSTSDGFHISCI